MSRLAYNLLAFARADEINWDYVAPVLAGQRVGQMMFVYFVGEEANGAVKIGKARDPISRLRGLQTGNPRRLTIERLIYGDEVVERLLHAYFRPHRLYGEWFSADARPQLFEAADEISVRQRALDAEITIGELLTTVGGAMEALGYVQVRDDECDGSMTCDCKLCAAERDARCKVGVRSSPQPWRSKA